IGRIGFKVRGDGPLPLVPVGQQFRLVVEQFLARLGGELEVRPLDDRIDRAGFLAEAAVDALGHVDVVARGAAAAVLARLGLYRDGERRAHRLAQFAGDAALLAVGIAAQRMLAAEARGERVLLERVVDRRLGLEEVLHRQPVSLDELPECERLDELGDGHADLKSDFVRQSPPLIEPSDSSNQRLALARSSKTTSLVLSTTCLPSEERRNLPDDPNAWPSTLFGR